MLSTAIEPPWRSAILRQSASPIPVPGVLAAAVQALEDAEDPGRVAGVEADPVVADADLGEAPVDLAVDPDHRRYVRRRNLIAFEIRFWNSWRICGSSTTTVGSGPTSTLPSAAWIVGLEVGDDRGRRSG